MPTQLTMIQRSSIATKIFATKPTAFASTIAHTSSSTEQDYTPFFRTTTQPVYSRRVVRKFQPVSRNPRQYIYSAFTQLVPKAWFKWMGQIWLLTGLTSTPLESLWRCLNFLNCIE